MDNNNFSEFSDTEKLLENTQVPPYKPQQKITLFHVSCKCSLPPPSPNIHHTYTVSEETKILKLHATKHSTHYIYQKIRP
jgi:hypothetical protein